MLVLLVFAVLVSTCAGKPNFVILFADDLGYGDLAAYGHPTSYTPNLDTMAREGLVFTQFYSAAPVCSPSRAALLTGRYQIRSGIYPDVLQTGAVGGLPLNETTIAKALKPAGYSSGMVGKWHLGVGKDNMYLPTNHGFDFYKGIPYNHGQCPCPVCFYPSQHCGDKDNPPFGHCQDQVSPCPIFENSTIVLQPANLLTLTETYINGAISFIKEQNERKTPFFMYIAFNHIHFPQFAGRQYTNSSIRGALGDALSELDWGVGQILSTLKELDIADNTFVFFTADNGPALGKMTHGGNAGPLRCGKGTTWEGGMREPGIAWWPGTVTPGKTTELAATLDLFPTIMKLAGANFPDATIDGVDMSPILFDSRPSNRDYFVYYPTNPDKDVGIYAIRWGKYKAHYYLQGSHCHNDFPDHVCRGNYTLRQQHPPLLFNIEEDPGEVYSLDTEQQQYANVVNHIGKIKKKFESDMWWAPSEVKKGNDPSLYPCAKPSCSSYPSCCHT